VAALIFGLRHTGVEAKMDNRNTPHELDEMFPQAKAAMHELKTHNAHFARLADEYHLINRAIHRMETNVEPTSDASRRDLNNDRGAQESELIARFIQTIH
jgi:uncharacterized protein YdcH (DUF465 family)